MSISRRAVLKSVAGAAKAKDRPADLTRVEFPSPADWDSGAINLNHVEVPRA